MIAALVVLALDILLIAVGAGICLARILASYRREGWL